MAGASDEAPASHLKTMNAKQAEFCLQYIVDLNATQAAIRAGYSENGASVTGTRLLANPSIRERVGELQAAKAEETEITAEYVLRGIRNIAETADRESDSLKAFELLGRYLGLWIDRKQMHAVVEHVQARPVEDAERAALDVLNTILLEQDDDNKGV